MKKVIVIGGGAAGMMAACMAAVEGAHVTLLEKMKRPERKFILQGKAAAILQMPAREKNSWKMS